MRSLDIFSYKNIFFWLVNILLNIDFFYYRKYRVKRSSLYRKRFNCDFISKFNLIFFKEFHTNHTSKNSLNLLFDKYAKLM